MHTDEQDIAKRQSARLSHELLDILAEKYQLPAAALARLGTKIQGWPPQKITSMLFRVSDSIPRKASGLAHGQVSDKQTAAVRLMAEQMADGNPSAATAHTADRPVTSIERDLDCMNWAAGKGLRVGLDGIVDAPQFAPWAYTFPQNFFRAYLPLPVSSYDIVRSLGLSSKTRLWQPLPLSPSGEKTLTAFSTPFSIEAILTQEMLTSFLAEKIVFVGVAIRGADAVFADWMSLLDQSLGPVRFDPDSCVILGDIEPQYIMPSPVQL